MICENEEGEKWKAGERERGEVWLMGRNGGVESTVR
jgi:hypothetical protein